MPDVPRLKRNWAQYPNAVLLVEIRKYCPHSAQNILQEGKYSDAFGSSMLDTMEKMIIEEDKTFLGSMVSDRLAYMVSYRLAAMEYKKEDRRRSEASRLKQHESSNSKNLPITDREITIQKKRCHPRLSYTGVPALIPHDIVKMPSVVHVATRVNIIPVQQAALTKLAIEESRGDIFAFLNRTHLQTRLGNQQQMLLPKKFQKIGMHTNDYREMARLCKVVLTDEDIPKKELHKPEAMDKARWMSKITYSIKHRVLGEQISLDGSVVTNY
ncbi:unnamed protein product [Lepeophtheirus salmonis]|uniref:(salmon louse) hypothetical protein n=1 Tax=Lepeophtheirus salmonis TaxID=72036 RepID=A0A7R8D4G5_LEPSM|nr:unnamed protein product [Lepeophtheirus salmonis]CAF2995468.1 unnamed protein product [Lepeophtheirus salmonis]